VCVCVLWGEGCWRGSSSLYVVQVNNFSIELIKSAFFLSYPLPPYALGVPVHAYEYNLTL
jgi:hypothetical protein